MRKSEKISIHGTLQVNWERDYDGSLCCVNCESNRWKVWRTKEGVCKVLLECAACRQKTALTCPLQKHIFGYQPEKVCPNPFCNQLGPDGKTKGWIFLYDAKRKDSKCLFCSIIFTDSEHSCSWVGRQKPSCTEPFSFEDDTWELRHFFENLSIKRLHFNAIQPNWYKQEVKRYLYHLLKVQNGSIGVIIVSLRQFGRLVDQWSIQCPEDITRDLVLAFLDSCKDDSSSTLHHKVAHLRDFFEWLQLDSHQLVRRRDSPKVSYNEPDWLDETVRVAIRQHLHLIPAPIARQYLLQEYTAARPEGICLIKFDCLVEENGKWYVDFYQTKIDRWYRLHVTREIRKVIEEQQQWIRQTLGKDYPYLFCHFWRVILPSYPNFPAMKPLPAPPPIGTNSTQMVRIIRKLIEAEGILDANGQRPHFTGKITRPSRLQEVRVKHGIEAAQIYANHKNITTTFVHYAPPTKEEVAKVDLPFQELLLNPTNRFLPWQSLPESLLANLNAHELDMEIGPRLVVYGYCALDPKVPCPYNLYPKCYGCGSFCPSTSKLPLYERQYAGEKQRMEKADAAGAELAFEEAKSTVEAMDKWLPDLRGVANG